jgi:toxin-antitoxin system PIN domain toxin
VIALDSNLLIYAHRRDSPWHGEAKRCLEELAEGKAAWAIPWPCLHEFLSVATHPRVYNPPSTLAAAIDQVEAWLESPSLVVLSERLDYWPTMASVLRAARVAGPLVHDARIAALCELHGVRELWTADRDFGRFIGLRTRNPLVQPPS